MDGSRSARHHLIDALPSDAMTLLQDRRLLDGLDVPVVDEAAARRALREQIARLERQLSDAVVSCFPHTSVDVTVPSSGAPQILTLGQLEAHRDALQGRLREVRAKLEARGAWEQANRQQLERMLLEPKKHKFARIHRADVGMGGCGAYQVRPRLGLVGMLMGWWQVKLSSGCPLAT